MALKADFSKKSRPPRLLTYLFLLLSITLPLLLVEQLHLKDYYALEANKSTSQLEKSFRKSFKKTKLEEPLNIDLKYSSLNSIDREEPQTITNLLIDNLNKDLLAPKILPIKKNNEEKINKGWIHVEINKSISLITILKQLNIDLQELFILEKIAHKKILFNLGAKKQIKFLINGNKVEKIIYPLTDAQYLIVYKEKNYFKSEIKNYKIKKEIIYFSATINNSLANTARKNNLPYKLIQQMIEIFNLKINLSKEVRSGDKFSIVYEAFLRKSKKIGFGEILAATYKSRNKNYEAIRHVNKNGIVGYFTPFGESYKKGFDRFPVRFSHISSTFSLGRYHPILHHKRAHKGVDLAAPLGTPIYATGDGKIEIIGRKSGYGNMVKINHRERYSTIYGHMLKFQKGLYKGSFVKRGQIIGYVGQTGLATGPHCHYEFHINHQPKNPTTIELPTALAISPIELANFKANAYKILAKVRKNEEVKLASNNSKSLRLAQKK